MTQQSLPNADTLPEGSAPARTAAFARSLLRLVGTGYQAAPGSMVEGDFLTYGEALARSQETVARAIAQGHMRTATDILSELEAEYGLPDGSAFAVEERQRNLLLKYRARSWPAPTAVLNTVRVLAAEALLTTNTSDQVDGTDSSAVFRFALLMSQTHLDDALLMEMLEASLAAQVSADEMWSIGRHMSFRCDDSNSACDVDLLAI